MAELIVSLRQLQEVDGELYKLRRARDEKPQALANARAKMAAAEARVKTAEDRAKVLQLKQKEREIELQTREASVRKLLGQLFQLKTNKDYTTMQHEINTLKADNSLLEEQALKSFDEIEQAVKTKQQEQQALAKEQDAFKKEEARIQQEQKAIDVQITELDAKRQIVAPNVPREALATYERVLESREGVALVPLVKDACGGCYRRMTPQVINQVFLKAKLTTCEQCNRILYFDEAHSTL